MTIDCRSCGGPLESVFDLGDHYLPDFIEPGAQRGRPWPLHLVLCRWCTLLQLAETTPRDELYHERYGFKSGVNEAIRADLADVVKCALDNSSRMPSTWLDIASNDGTLLSNVPRVIHRTGIDPLKQFAAEALEHANRVIGDYFSPRFFERGEFDVITSVSMFYDLDDPNEFVAGVKRVLHPDGVWVIQQNYALDMVRKNAIDNVCHEHVTYFSVASLRQLLARHDLEINEVTYSPVNGGCFRTLVTHAGSRPEGESVFDAILSESSLRDCGTLQRWAQGVCDELARTTQEIESATGDTWVYGASTRGGTILQLMGLGPEQLPFAVERQPAKWGKIMAATNIPIISERQMREDPPSRLLVSPWFFRDVFVHREAEYLRNGGRMIFPLPWFEVVTR